jgi:hypothetical protein
MPRATRSTWARMHAVPLGAQRETKSSAVSDCAAVNLSGLAESAKREWAIYTRALALPGE